MLGECSVAGGDPDRLLGLRSQEFGELLRHSSPLLECDLLPRLPLPCLLQQLVDIALNREAQLIQTQAQVPDRVQQRRIYLDAGLLG